MGGTREGALKGAKTKREQGFDFAAAGRRGGKKKVAKGMAKLPKKTQKKIASKGGRARHNRRIFRDAANDTAEQRT